MTGPDAWGVLHRQDPFSVCFGYDRGTPVDRVFIDEFMAASAGLIRSPVLEVGDAEYATRFGAGRPEVDVLDVDPHNDGATVVGDLCDPATLEPGRYGCAIVTQSLQYVRNPWVAVENLHRSLAPGGTLLVTVPGVSRTDPVDDGLMADRWRFTPYGLRDLLGSVFDPESVRWRGYGGLRSATAFLYGLSAEETGPLAPDPAPDTEFPVVVCASAVRAS